MTARRVVSLRLHDPGIDRVHEIAEREGTSWSESARVMLDFAAKHMPVGYGTSPTEASRQESW